MPSIVDFKRTGLKFDRRIKLSYEDKCDIVKYYRDGTAVRQLARTFNVSRRLIQFIVRPEAHERNLELRSERGGTMIYYDKNKHRKSTFEHRKYKEQLLSKHLI